MDVLLRDLPEEVHAELARRARARHVSLRAYLTEVLSAHVAAPDMDAWLVQVRALGPAFSAGPGGAELVERARGEDDELTGR